MCKCYELLLKDYKFSHYDSSKDRLGSVFDDFGTYTYIDEKNQKHTWFYHSHLGVYESGEHTISIEEIPKEWREKATRENNNSLIPDIKAYIISTRLDKKQIFCKDALTKKGCSNKNCQYSHKKENFYCTYKRCKCEFSHHPY